MRHLVLILVFSLFVFQPYDASAQFRGQRNSSGGQREGGGGGGPIQGKVQAIDQGSITVALSTGATESFSITGSTRFVREAAADRGSLAAGDRVLVMGRRSGSTVDAMIITIQAGDEEPEERPFGQDRGPIIGRIESPDPLIVRTDSGGTSTVNLTGRTRVMREELVDPLDVRPGADVRIVAPMRPGTGTREALRVVLTDGEGPPPPQRTGDRGGREAAAQRPRQGEAAEAPSVAMDLLPDLGRVGGDGGFLYGIWLGRGPFSNSEVEQGFKIAKNLGFRHVMVEVKWDYVEPANDRWTWRSAGMLDVEHVIRLAKKYDMAVIPYFDIFMPWGEKKQVSPGRGECQGPPSGMGQSQAPDPEEYAEYVFTVVDKLRDGGVDVKYIELDNEESNLNDGYRSMNCFINLTAKELKAAENAAYARVKAEYPDIMVSSTTFSFPGISAKDEKILAEDRKMRHGFIEAYFGEEPRPRFDFLGLHETVGGSGNPYTTLKKPADAEFNFSSYHEGYDVWRSVLDKYGYRDVPIMNLESGATLKDKQDAELIQNAVFARANADRNMVAGWVLASVMKSRQLTGGARREGVGGGVGILDLSDGRLREGYKGLYALMKTLARYPLYKGRVMGELNVQGGQWVEKFGDYDGDLLYVAFVPYGSGPDVPQTVSIDVGPEKEAKVTRSDAGSSFQKSDKAGLLSLKVGQHPVFIEVKR